MPIIASFSSGSLKSFSLPNLLRTVFPVNNLAYVVVAGGGSTGVGTDTWLAGGGGAGGFLSGNVSITSGLTFTVSVGAGGGTNASGTNSSIKANNLSILNATSIGGGRGGCYNRYQGYYPPTDGGSGGGNAGPIDGSGFLPGGLGTPGQGYAGGGTPLTTGGPRSQAGGGGAGGVGQDGVTGYGGYNGVGGAGLPSSITGTPVVYAKGGDGTGGTDGPANSGYGADSQGLSLGGSGVAFLKIANTSIASYTGSPTLLSIGDGATIFKFTGAGSVTLSTIP